ncbi:pyrroline-5-carboxylate reductase [Gulosibacter chungangensis]|uniref:pyrroline-5-carboxylate reductase n=1 Tax=Gulosibacter chungangensis TaxID=979746 RepID=UPI001CE4AB2A|nr:pyrroline-5-carboxylate reductase [Gulosibacter chungangensis]
MTPAAESTNAPATPLPTIAMIGTGNMNSAILYGLLDSPVAPRDAVRVTTRSQASAEKFAADDRITAFALETDPEANRKAASGADIVLLGVKPAQIVAVAEDIADVLHPETVVISVAAGIETATVEARLPEGIRVVRVMPNTPSQIGLGATGVAAGKAADAQAMALARTIFESVGSVYEVPESQISAIGAVAGSGPAHVYLLIEQMARATERLGVAYEEALDLTVQTFKGAIEMALQDEHRDVIDLRRKVTSPNGTTEQSIKVLLDADLTATFEQALRANQRRSDELAAENR